MPILLLGITYPKVTAISMGLAKSPDVNVDPLGDFLVVEPAIDIVKRSTNEA